MIIDQELKVAEVVSENIQTAHIFKKYGIDFCCGGGISIAKACDKKKVNINELLSELKSIDNKMVPSQNYNNWKLDFLVDYIVNTHHSYVIEAFALLDSYTAKVSKVHGEHHPAVLEIERIYKEIKAELLAHMQKEEQILFPYIKQLVVSTKDNTPLIKSHFGTVRNPIQMMQQEHENAGDLLKEIAELTMNYTAPEGACNTFKAMYAKLDEFEQDLHLHIHLENNILFPKAILLEERLQNVN
jgi:regulator of cell morphogenesis and NO signaling